MLSSSRDQPISNSGHGGYIVRVNDTLTYSIPIRTDVGGSRSFQHLNSMIDSRSKNIFTVSAKSQKIGFVSLDDLNNTSRALVSLTFTAANVQTLKMVTFPLESPANNKSSLKIIIVKVKHKCKKQSFKTYTNKTDQTTVFL